MPLENGLKIKNISNNEFHRRKNIRKRKFR